MPTCFKAYNQYLYFGLKSGAIILYNIKTKSTLTTIQQFDTSVIQIQIINKQAFIATDQVGNLKILTLNIKMFMDRIVKVGITAYILVQHFRVKKRDKIKNFVKNFSFKASDKNNKNE